METSIFKYILRYSAPQQIILTVIAAASFPFLYAFYELPKQIVNGAIQAENAVFPIEIAGLEFGQIDYLFLLSGLFLVLVAINQAFKYSINVYRGRTGERMLRRLRYDLYARVLRFPLPQFRRTSQGEVIQMITAEVEPLGGFIGDAFSLPAFQGGTLLVILAFLMWQNPYMAGAAVALYPLQFYLIPKLQRRVNLLGKERVRLVRRLSDRIGETISGIQEIHAHGTAAHELADFSKRLGGIFEVRLKIYIWKFIIKFINNTINQIGPFCFYSIGGYLVIEGELEIGTLMAAIAAHKDLAAPWKELLSYYQRREDARIKFEQVIEQFQPAGMMDEALQLEAPEEIAPFTGEVAAANVALGDDSGATLLDGASFVFDVDTHVAIVGVGGSGKGELGLLLARLMVPDSGTLTIAGNRASGMPEAVAGRRIGYVGSGAHLFASTVRENLFYGLRHRPQDKPHYSGEDEKYWRDWFHEAAAAGNSTDDLNAEWVDYAAAGAADAGELNRRAFDVLAMVDMGRDIYEMGLRGAISADQRENLTGRLLEARAVFRRRLSDPQIAALVESLDVEVYNDNSTLGENLLFGTPVGDAFDMDRLAENPYVLDILDKERFTDDLIEIGRQVAATMVELFSDLPPGHEFFEQYSFIGSDDLPEYQTLLARVARDGVQELRGEERTMLLSLPFRISQTRHRLGLIDDALKARILSARRRFAENLPADLRGAVEFFDAGRLNTAASVQDNILFGKLAYGQAHGAERVGKLIAEVIDELNLRPVVMEIGMDFQVGIGGARLSQSQRQKLAIARAVLKRPDILILNEATTSLDGASQAKIMENLKAEFAGRGLIWVLSNARLADSFDHVLVMRNGKVVAQGPFGELDKEDSDLRELIVSE